MSRYGFGRRSDYGARRRYWPRSRAAGCLLWVVLLVVLLIVLSVLFGGFQKGTKVNGLSPVRTPVAVAGATSAGAAGGGTRGGGAASARGGDAHGWWIVTSSRKR